jgi:4-diphosphocytidyl-2-C-methyl-D-erythritol kinase
MSALTARAPGKVNLCLFVGRPRSDGLHPLVSLVQPVSLADDVTMVPGGDADEVVCEGVEGPNLAAAALAAFRAATGWSAPPQRVTIVKRVPVAAGMGGGSADAAAALRLAARGEVPADELRRIAFTVGADVPAQVEPRRTLMLDAGERVEPVAGPDPFGLVVVPPAGRLATADVYRACDALGHSRPHAELAELEAAVRDAARSGAPLPLELAVNDLQAAARSLRPEIDAALAALAGADGALVSGSGPTVFGVFADPARAQAAAARIPGAVAATPVGPEFAAVRPA